MCKILPFSGQILNCSAHLLTLPLPSLPVNYRGLRTQTCIPRLPSSSVVYLRTPAFSSSRTENFWACRMCALACCSGVLQSFSLSEALAPSGRIKGLCRQFVQEVERKEKKKINKGLCRGQRVGGELQHCQRLTTRQISGCRRRNDLAWWSARPTQVHEKWGGGGGSGKMNY